MHFLLDTNIVSYILKSPHGVEAIRFHSTPREAMCLSSIVEAELRFGAGLMDVGARARRDLAAFLADIDVVPWDSKSADHHARLRILLRRQPLSWPDSMIAAHALALGCTLVTHDQAFARVPGLQLQDWTKGPRLL